MSMAVDAVAASRIFEASSSRCASRTSCCRCQVSCLFRSQRLTLSVGRREEVRHGVRMLGVGELAASRLVAVVSPLPRRFDTAWDSPMVSAQASGGTGQGITALRWFGVWDSGFNLRELQL
jgi:hypothetical protein